MKIITHVAIRFNGVVWSLPRPYRHGHVQAIYALLWRPEMRQPRGGGDGDDQGFLDEDGKFLTREEAEVVARASGQLTKPIIGGELTSEDLW